MTFSNQALLSYRGGQRWSNLVVGTITSALTLTKTVLANSYTADSRFYYQVTVSNTSATAYPNVQILDDFGRYLWNTLPRFPLGTDGSVQLTIYRDGNVQTGAVSVDVSTDGIYYCFDLPPMSTALLQYPAHITAYAPLSAGSALTNTITLTAPGLAEPLSAQATLPVAEEALLRLSKTLCSDTPAPGDEITYFFQLANYGNVPAGGADGPTISDRFFPRLTDLSVSLDGVPWTQDDQYTYSLRTGLFQTNPGAITVPAAVYARDRLGRWNTTPGSVLLKVTGTLAEASPQEPSSAPVEIEVLPAYADGREVNLRAEQHSYDSYRLHSNGAVPPAFMILTAPEAAVTLEPGSDPRVSLNDGLLTAPAGVVGQMRAVVRVSGEGYALPVQFLFDEHF